MKKLAPSVSVVFLLAIVSANTAAAQTSGIEVSGGYQLTHVPDQLLPLGWNADAAINLTNAWHAVGEVTGAYRTVNDESLGIDVRLSIHTFAAGARWSFRPQARVSPHLQMLAGSARLRASADVGRSRLGDSSTKFMVQPGAGVMLRVNESMGLVWQFDYRRIFLDDESNGASGENHLRIGVSWGLDL
jgi:opacity protein-like surface antigen